MTDLWTPAGNATQTEIDIKLEVLFSRRSQIKQDLMLARYELIQTEELIKENKETLAFLKKEAKVVSLSEYILIKHNFNKTNLIKNKYLSVISTIKDKIKDLDKKEKDLLELREKNKTVILEFSSYERKRP